MKRFVRATACLTLAVCLLASSGSVWAEGPGETSVPESLVNIGFEENTGPTKPVDPDNPKIPGPDPDGGTQMPGPVSLDYASPLEFGLLEIQAAEQSYPTKTEKPYVQVTDNRGVGTGWTLEASLSSFTQLNPDSGEREATLPGAELYLKGGSPLSANPTLKPPRPEAVVKLSTDNTPTLVLTGVKPADGSDQYGPGTGTWVNRWYEAAGGGSVELTVYGGTAIKGEHTATITWLLVASV